mgnify:CR=1 FL=1
MIPPAGKMLGIPLESVKDQCMIWLLSLVPEIILKKWYIVVCIICV